MWHGRSRQKTGPQLSEPKGKNRVAYVLHLSAGQCRDDCMGMKKRQAAERTGILPFYPFAEKGDQSNLQSSFW